MRHTERALAALAVGAVLACGGEPRRSPAAPSTSPSPAIVETVGEVGIVALAAGDFDRLAPSDRAMAYYLVRAAIAGRDLEYDEGGPYNLEVRDLLEEILTHPRSLDPVFRDRLLQYLKRFWINNGNHDRITGAKFVPDFSDGELRAGARAAQLDGAEIRLAIGEPLAAKIERLRAAIFDTTFEPQGGCGAGAAAPPDPVRAARRAAAVRTTTGFLAKAAAFAGPAQAVDLKLLSVALRDPTPVALSSRLDGWLPLDPVVDTVAGPVTGCRSDHGRAGAWRALVWMGEPETTRRLRALAAMGGAATGAATGGATAGGAIARDATAGSTVVAASLLTAIGAAGPAAPSTLAVPDDAAPGSTGRRCVVLGNVLEATDRALLEPIVEAFAAPEDRPLLLERGRAASHALAALHAVLGHDAVGAGRPAAASPGRPSEDDRRLLEETRADLVALNHLTDERLVSIGLFTSPDDAVTALRLYLVRALAQLRAAGPAGRPPGDAAGASWLVATWLREHGAGVEAISSDGRAWLRVTDPEAARRGLGELLGEVERRLGNGDGRETHAFVERFASRIDPALRAEIDRRAIQAGIPLRLACVMVDVIPVRDPAGEVTDARIGPITDFTLQMLRYSGKLPFETAAH